MASTIDDDIDGWDRTFLNASSKLDVLSWAWGYRLVAPLDPHKFDNATSKTKELGIRALIALGAVASFVLAGLYILIGAATLTAGSKLFRSIGFAFQKNGFTHIRGSASEEPLTKGEAKILTWNLRGDKRQYTHGLVHWRSRIDPIVASIQAEDPNIVVLQEIHDIALVETLVQKLGDRYAHFYAHMGGCLVITKCAVDRFVHTNYEDESGFEMIEIKARPEDAAPCIRLIGTQLTSEKEAKERRIEQVAQIIRTLGKETDSLPTFFVGSMSADRDSEEGTVLSKYLSHSYRDTIPTHSAELVRQWTPLHEGQEESTDYISLFKRHVSEGLFLPVIEKGVSLRDCHLVPAFEENPETGRVDTKTARSDHHGVYAAISLPDLSSGG